MFILCSSDDNDYSQDCLTVKWDGIHHRYIHCPCMDTASRFEECCIVQPTCLNVIHHHSLFILPPSSLHAKANLILGLLIVGAFSQAFFQFTSISSSQCASRLPPQKGKKFLLWGFLIRDWLTSLPHRHHPHFQPLFSFLFLMSCSFPVKWIITVGIILVTWHYLDEVNNWNLCLKGFYLDERKGSAGRVGRAERVREIERESTHTFV